MQNKEEFLAIWLGECIPEWKEESFYNGIDREYFKTCLKCGINEYRHRQMNPFQFADKPNKFFILWNWAKIQEWFGKFIWDNGSRDICALREDLISYENFSTSLYNFLKDK